MSENLPSLVFVNDFLRLMPLSFRFSISLILLLIPISLGLVLYL